MRKKKKRIPWFLIIILLALLAGGGYFGYKMYKDSKAFKVEVIIDEINVREDKTLYSKQIGTVKKGQIYNVLEINMDDPRYVWYKIKMQNGSFGWIATGRNNRYVKEINNPEGEGDEEFFADYGKPKIIFQENEITFADLDSINYDHLTVTDDSNCQMIAKKSYNKAKEKNPKENYCQVSHEVFYEAEPKDSDIPQFWIQYTVVDEAGNSSSKVQKIIFLNEPNPEEVKDFADMVQ